MRHRSEGGFRSTLRGEREDVASSALKLIRRFTALCGIAVRMAQLTSPIQLWEGVEDGWHAEGRGEGGTQLWEGVEDGWGLSDS